MFLLFRYLMDTLGRLFGSHPTYIPPPAETPAHFLHMQIRSQLLDMHNELRRVKGKNLRPLHLDRALNTVAQEHAEWMAANHCVEHERPQPRLELKEEEDGIFMPPIDLVARITNTYGFFVEAGQNLARGPSDLCELMCGWKRCEKNCDVMLNPHFAQCGFGIAQDGLGRYYWCAIFVRPFMSSMLLPIEVGIDTPEPLLTAIETGIRS